MDKFRAFKVESDYLAESSVACGVSAGKVRYFAASGAEEWLGWSISDAFKRLRVRRLPEFDEWAASQSAMRCILPSIAELERQRLKGNDA